MVSVQAGTDGCLRKGFSLPSLFHLEGVLYLLEGVLSGVHRNKLPKSMSEKIRVQKVLTPSFILFSRDLGDRQFKGPKSYFSRTEDSALGLVAVTACL